MTPAELRDLDARIHREVMGLPVHTDKATGVHFQDTDHYQFVPHYSTDIAAAWQVVDWWRNPERPGGYGELIAASEGAPDSGLWVVQLGAVAKAHANTLPLAICLAALKAVSTKET